MVNSKEMKETIDKVFEDLNKMSEEELRKELREYKKGYWHDILLRIFDERGYTLFDGSIKDLKRMSVEDLRRELRGREKYKGYLYDVISKLIYERERFGLVQACDPDEKNPII